jgi:hypothetical protein
MYMNKIPRHRPHPARPPRRRPRRWLWLAAAPLAACLTAAYPSAALGGTAASSPTPQLNCGGGKGPPVSCYSPQEYETAYGVAPLLRRGIDGRGETVAMLTLAQTPSDPGATDIRKDLAAFDTKFGLPRARLHVVTAIAGDACRGLHRLQRRTRLGPGHRLGQPRRPVPGPPAGTHRPLPRVARPVFDEVPR